MIHSFTDTIRKTFQHYWMMWTQSNNLYSSLNGSSLKLVDKFTYLRSSVSSTENDINIPLVKAWTAINRLSIIWKWNLINKYKDRIKCNFSKQWSCQFYYMDADKAYREKAKWELRKNATSYIEQILEVTSHETADLWPPTSYL